MPARSSHDTIVSNTRSREGSAEGRPAAGWYRVANAEMATVRPAPNRTEPGVLELRRGHVGRYDRAVAGERIGENPWWLRLRGGRGWVHASLLSRTSAPRPRTDQPPAGRYATTTELNVRPEPSTARDRTGQLADGERFAVSGSREGETVYGNPWWLRLADGGYVSAAFARLLARDDALSPGSALMAAPRAPLARAQRAVLGRPHGEYTEADVREILRLYWETCADVGLDPLLLVAQMVHETANLSSYWAARPRRNPAGLGVTGAPGAGVWFPDWRSAVRAHCGRMLAYALPAGEGTDAQRWLIAEALEWRPLPDRYRGIAPTLARLAGTWAADPAYARGIIRHAQAIQEA